MNIARKVAKLRSALDMSQTQFGRLVGTSQANVCKWETGRRRPGDLTAELIQVCADAVGKSPRARKRMKAVLREQGRVAALYCLLRVAYGCEDPAEEDAACQAGSESAAAMRYVVRATSGPNWDSAEWRGPFANVKDAAACALCDFPNQRFMILDMHVDPVRCMCPECRSVQFKSVASFCSNVVGWSICPGRMQLAVGSPYVG